MHPKSTSTERFWAYVDTSAAPDGCWEWTGYRRADGYGHIHIGDKTVYVHRYAWELANGPIPAGMSVCHRCDVRICVNPDHLFLGTHVDNMADMVEKDRQARGSTNGNARLTETQVMEICARHAAGGTTYRSLAREFGVGKSTISRIVHRTNWTHLDEAA